MPCPPPLPSLVEEMEGTSQPSSCLHHPLFDLVARDVNADVNQRFLVNVVQQQGGLADDVVIHMHTGKL